MVYYGYWHIHLHTTYIYVQYVYCKTGITNSMATMMMIYGDILTTIEDLWIIGGGVLPQKVGSVPEHS